ncbi:hypothetical protein [Roseibacillus ishigakijimensis]|uniref:MetA-pathway of phenol degradation n=1 Tax=Roseibacillus ishigakijimensis TaxID=454146 RepID=A0A934RP75_9BACT|nr:hypothetical protein [Roseibacillus ishigakijimensis]MBK1834428.1 hypothetical protein [Roseibacillus ishigakijimensis]
MRSTSTLLLWPLPLAAHHGQDFLVTLDTGTPEPWHWTTTTGFEFTAQSDGDEVSALQGIALGLPGGFNFSTALRFADEGSGAWDALALSPALQWNTPTFDLPNNSTVTFGMAFGWEFPLEKADHDHGSHGHPQLEDCSQYLGNPFAYAVCQLTNQNSLNHSHDEGTGHSHGGIHRHGESHGFLRLIAELRLGESDRLAANLVAVFPEDGDVAMGYALAYRHSFTHHFAMGLEATGDFDLNKEHLLYLTATNYLTHDFSVTFGGAAGLTADSPSYSLQALATWRF